MSTSLKSIGDFRVIDTLGKGDFAIVYKVVKDSKEYALKLAHADSTDARIRLRIEAKALKELNHPTIPGYISAGIYDNRPYVVMRLARGRSLRDELQQKHKCGAVFGDIETLELLEKLLSGLSHVHHVGFVHRDIKDANVIAGFICNTNAGFDATVG